MQCLCGCAGTIVEIRRIFDLVLVYRVLGLVVDWILASLLFGGLILLLALVRRLVTGDGSLDVTVPWPCYALYFLAFWGWRGATPGKILFGLRIVDADTGDPPAPWQCWVRLLGCLVAAFPFGLGLLWVLWDPRHQGWHDHIAGTVVARSETREPVAQL